MTVSTAGSKRPATEGRARARRAIGRDAPHLRAFLAGGQRDDGLAVRTPRRLAQVIYRRLLGVEAPVDVLVVTPEDVEEFEDKAGTIIGPALREGREVYVA